MRKRVLDAVRQIAHDRHKLVLVVGPFGCGKTALLQQLVTDLTGEYVNLNLQLSERLLARPRRDYADGVTTNRLIDELCDELSPAGQVLLVDNAELLFSPELGRLNPVDTFKRIARQRVVVLALPAKRAGSAIEYSVLDRADYMRIPVEDYTVIELDGGEHA